jgi:hypothetical protein
MTLIVTEKSRSGAEKSVRLSRRERCHVMTFVIAVPLATDRQAKKEACLNQRSNTANPPLQHISSSEDLSSSFAPSASQGHKNKNGAAAHLAVERDVQVSPCA